MNYREAVAFGTENLRGAGVADAELDAWYLLQMVCKIERSFYYVHGEEPVPEDKAREYEIAVRKRAERIPLQYITGEQEFMGLKFKVNSSVLIPRQDTETLVEEAIRLLRPGMQVLDLCTGSGCVLISILKNVPDTAGVGSDISKQALLVAKENARFHEVEAEWVRGDLLDNIVGTYDVIVSNPPYIPTSVIAGLMPEVRDFEPIEALDGREDGLYFYRRILKDVSSYLKPDGWLCFEVGHDQGTAVFRMMRDAGFFRVEVVRDLAGNDRVVKGKVNP